MRLAAMVARVVAVDEALQPAVGLGFAVRSMEVVGPVTGSLRNAPT